MEGPSVLTTIHNAPKLEDYVTVAEHQSRTPETFFGGKPVLHYHAAGATAYVPESQRRRLPVFRTAAPAASTEGDSEVEQQIKQIIDVFVNSETFTIFSQDATCGVSIPYPLIGIHAVKTLEHGGADSSRVQSVYLQLDLLDGGADDETYDTVELTIVPPPPASNATSTPPEDVVAPAPSSTSNGTKPVPTQAEALFAAISTCADLHPDPIDGDNDDNSSDGGGGVFEIDDRIVFESAVTTLDPAEGYTGVFRGAADGGLPPPLPGSSGWITAENVHEYFDADGNWIGGGGDDDDDGTVSGELGEGAGHVRGRDEVEAAERDADAQEAAAAGGSGAGSSEEEEAGVANGHGNGTDEGDSKRLRTE